MTEFRIRETGVIMNEKDFRLTREEVFPSVIAPPLADALGIDAILPAPQPESAPGFIVVRDGAVQDELGNWVQAWKILPLPEADLALELEAKKEVIELYLVEVREMRERLLNRLAGIVAAAIVTGDQDTQRAFVAAREKLLDITQAEGVVSAVQALDLEALKLAVKGEYTAIVLQSPSSLTKAFKELDK